MPEEESFAVLVKIMQDYRMREMFKPSMAELGKLPDLLMGFSGTTLGQETLIRDHMHKFKYHKYHKSDMLLCD